MAPTLVLCWVDGLEEGLIDPGYGVEVAAGRRRGKGGFRKEEVVDAE